MYNYMIPIYIINYDNELRKANMKARLDGLNINFIDCVNVDNKKYNIDKETARNWSIMLSHMESIRHFYFHTSDEYSVFCEDDVYIHRSFNAHIDRVIHHMKQMEFDIVLLSYLINRDPSNYGESIYKCNGFQYYSYEDDLWGAHMYLISRRYADDLIKKYDLNWALNNTNPFSPDWTITKGNKKAFLWPPLGVEEGEVNTDNNEQINFHRSCTQFLLNYNFI